MQYIDKIIKDPSDRAQANAEDAEEQQERPDTLFIATDPVHSEKTHEVERAPKAPPDMKTGRSLRTCLSRVVPADHEAQSQVKDRKEKALEEKRGDACVQDRESHQST